MDNRSDERLTPRFLRSILETASSPIAELPWVYSSAWILFLGAKFTGMYSDMQDALLMRVASRASDAERAGRILGNILI